jgi:phosphoenolpyruvate synthase/pyruvate phosphate dikinase
MNNNLKVIYQFNEVNGRDYMKLGDKSMSVGSIYNLSIPTPPGFIISADTYNFFVDITNLKEQIKDLLEKTDFDDENSVQEVSSRIEDSIMKSEIPPSCEREIARAYSKLSGFSDSTVSVRSSYIFGENVEIPDNIVQTTFINIKGLAELTLAVKACWASLFEPEVLKYRKENKVDVVKTSTSVLIQKMVQVEASGLMFTVSPIDRDLHTISIQSILGTLDGIKSGEITPDNYHIDKKTLKFREKEISKQEYMFVKNHKSKSNADESMKVKIASKWQENQKVDNKNIITLARYGLLLEDMYKRPQAVEWSMEKGKLWVLKSLNMSSFDEDDLLNMDDNTDIKEDKKEEEVTDKKEEENNREEKEDSKIKKEEDIVEPQEAEPQEVAPHDDNPPESVTAAIRYDTNLLLTGSPAYPGIVYGQVKVLKDLSEQDIVENGDIIVCENINDDWREVLRKVNGLIIDKGGVDSKAVQIAKEMDIPCIVGAEIGTKVLVSGEKIFFDGSVGRIYKDNSVGSTNKSDINDNTTEDIKKESEVPSETPPEDVIPQEVTNEKVESVEDTKTTEPTQEAVIEPVPEPVIEPIPEPVPEPVPNTNDEQAPETAPELEHEEITQESTQEVVTDEPSIEPEVSASPTVESAILESEDQETNTAKDNDDNKKPRNEKSILTATKVYTTIFDSKLSKEIPKTNLDGVVVYADDLILDLKVHPKQILSIQKNKEYIENMSKKVIEICDNVTNTRNVIYTLSNFTSNEFLQLEGGVQFEIQEENPLIGYRGTLRNIKEIEVLNMELEIIKNVRNKHGYKNLWVMVPYVRTPEELVEMKKIISSQNLKRSSTFKIFIDLQVPSNIIAIDDLLDIGVDGININLDELSQMVLGIDYKNPKIQKEVISTNSIMRKAIESILKSSNEHKILNSISGRNISDDQEFLEFLIKHGMNIINSETDKIYSVKEKIAQIEREHILRKT